MNIQLMPPQPGSGFQGGNCSENVCVMLVKFQPLLHLWIILCKKRYKAGFCCGMQQTAKFVINTGCGLRGSPYNALSLTRHSGQRNAVTVEERRTKSLTSKAESVVYAARDHESGPAL